MTSGFQNLSIVLITLNEENNIRRLLASLPEAAEIIIVDSKSIDDTREIASTFGAKVFTRPFDDYASQRNYALQHSTRPWILSLDADESLSGELLGEIEKITSVLPCKDRVIGYQITRKLVFMGRVLRFGRTVDAPLRLFPRESGNWQGAVHEKFRFFSNISGKVKKAEKGFLFHYSYSDLSDYFVRFNRYTSAVASANKARGRKEIFLIHLLRPWGEFIYRYFLRLGFLDGYPGYTYALISSLYAYVKYAKFYELEESGKKN